MILILMIKFNNLLLSSFSFYYFRVNFIQWQVDQMQQIKIYNVVAMHHKSDMFHRLIVKTRFLNVKLYLLLISLKLMSNRKILKIK
jgi:hypothetical protein